MTRNPLKQVAGKDTGFDGVNPDIIRGAKNNDIAEVQAALKKDWQDINKRDGAFDMTAMHFAAAKGNASMVSFLLEQKAVDVTLKDKWDRDALDVAIVTGNQEIIDELFRFRQGLEPDDGEPESPAPNNPDIIPFKPK
ncbi:ankyrin repeat domain-containing protein [uncultured Cohaesibacter sp.]|uniref:ankyrin repeat domain-containing protein n=1 Tax=uncultured Cohaesibacter sp. TaxID=1002546 RepID=UPI00292DFD95|nr:ankyrin repeat domain-containing protein [uncultured Cohaesibacter sp.]